MIELTKDIVPVYLPLLADTSRYSILYGGAGSGKSVFASQKVLLRCLLARHKIAVIRKVARTLRQSTFARILSQLTQWGIRQTVMVNKSDMVISFPNGSELLFVGLDDPEKLKSIDGLTSVWIEEATEISQADFTQVDLRLRGITDHYKQILLSFNPITVSHWLKGRFFDNPSKGMTSVVKTTYKDNPFCDSQYVDLMDDLAVRNADLYRVYGQGDWGELKGLVYPAVKMVDVLPEATSLEAYGLDFGFNAPSALILAKMTDVNWKRRTGNLFLKEELYETQLSNTELGDKMRAIGINRTTPIYADSAEPARIKELKRQGFNIKPATKGKGSILAGIALVQSMHIHSHEDNVNLNRELSTYSWETDTDDKPTDKPVGVDDHALDAMRYAVWSMMKNPPRTIKGK